MAANLSPRLAGPAKSLPMRLLASRSQAEIGSPALCGRGFFCR